MCWSAEVSAFFSIAGAVCLVILILRKQWLYLLAQSPIVVQEMWQYFLWKNIGKDANTCNESNRKYSFLCTVTVLYLPIAYSLWAKWSVPQRKAMYRMKRIEVNVCLGLAIAYFLSAFTYTVWGLKGKWYPYCTYAGGWGHQVWPMMTPPLPPWLKVVDKYGTTFPALVKAALTQVFHYGWYLGYMGLGCMSLGFVTGGELPRLAMLCLGPGLIVPLYLLIGPEFGSVWCWAAAIGGFFMVIEPWILENFPMIHDMIGGSMYSETKKELGLDDITEAENAHLEMDSLGAERRHNHTTTSEV